MTPKKLVKINISILSPYLILDHESLEYKINAQQTQESLQESPDIS